MIGRLGALGSWGKGERRMLVALAPAPGSLSLMLWFSLLLTLAGTRAGKRGIWKIGRFSRNVWRLRNKGAFVGVELLERAPLALGMC